MCRNIDYMAANALYSGKNWSQGNTYTADSALYLHGSKIAWLDGGVLYINLCGYDTQTTRARLNALAGVNLVHKGGKLYLNGTEINDETTYKIN